MVSEFKQIPVLNTGVLNSRYDPEETARYEEALYFLDSLQVARIHRLEPEFVMGFVQRLRTGKTVIESAYDALCEWDI